MLDFLKSLYKSTAEIESNYGWGISDNYLDEARASGYKGSSAKTEFKVCIVSVYKEIPNFKGDFGTKYRALVTEKDCIFSSKKILIENLRQHPDFHRYARSISVPDDLFLHWVNFQENFEVIEDFDKHGKFYNVVEVKKYFVVKRGADGYAFEAVSGVSYNDLHQNIHRCNEDEFTELLNDYSLKLEGVQVVDFDFEDGWGIVSTKPIEKLPDTVYEDITEMVVLREGVTLPASSFKNELKISLKAELNFLNQRMEEIVSQKKALNISVLPNEWEPAYNEERFITYRKLYDESNSNTSRRTEISRQLRWEAAPISYENNIKRLENRLFIEIGSEEDPLLCYVRQDEFYRLCKLGNDENYLCALNVYEEDVLFALHVKNAGEVQSLILKTFNSERLKKIDLDSSNYSKYKKFYHEMFKRDVLDLD